jgi:hypothetical protein
MFAAEVPELPMIIPPVKTSPRLNKIESPGKILVKKELSLATVFQGVDGFCAWVDVRESFPSEVEK